MMRRLLSQHMLTECPKRTQPCSYCAKEFLYDTIQVGRRDTDRRSGLLWDGSELQMASGRECPLLG